MDEPRYCTDSDAWRQWRARRAMDDWIVQSAYGAMNFDLLVRCIAEAMADELSEYQQDHAYEHAGLDA